jgi:hypothetical protein
MQWIVARDTAKYPEMYRTAPITKIIHPSTWLFMLPTWKNLSWNFSVNPRHHEESKQACLIINLRLISINWDHYWHAGSIVPYLECVFFWTAEILPISVVLICLLDLL